MNPRDEIENVRRRIGALEYELQQLRLRVNAIETSVAPAIIVPRETVQSNELLSVATTEMNSGASPQIESPPPGATGVGELPPLLEPVSAETNAQAGPAPATAPGRITPRVNSWREWLEPLQLWPPLGEENAEVRLAAWWATRLGALLAVIGIVFLGIYVSREAAPWVRLVEVGAVTLGVIGLGVWLERILPRFGAVVFGAGLALAYFSAFAAYAVAPMKVITNPITATLVELAVVGVILAVAWRRASPAVATMAVGLGHLTAFMALRAGPAFGPWVVLTLSAVAVFLRLARNWSAPSALALPLAWLFLLASSVGRQAEPMSLTAAWIWTAVFYVVFVARDWIAARRGQEISRIDRTLQVTNSSLAVVVGWAAAAQAGGSNVTAFYFGSGGILLATAAAWRNLRGAEHLIPVLICKGAGLVALGLIAAFEGQARSLALLAQAFVMVVSARTSGVRGLRVAALVAGAVALGFYVGELESRAPLALTGSGWLEVIFVVAAGAFVAALERWLGVARSVVAGAALLVGLAGILTASRWPDAGWSPVQHIALGAGVWAVAALLRGSLAGGVAGALLAVAAHVQLWLYPESKFGVALLWGNEAALLVIAAAVVVALSRRRDAAVPREAHGALVALVTATFVVVCFKTLPSAAALAMAGGVSALLVLAAARAPRWPVAGLSAFVLVLGGALYLREGHAGPADLWLGLAAATAWMAPILLVGWTERWSTIHDATWRAWSPAVQTALATAITVLALQRNLHADARVLVTGGVALGVFALGRRPGLRPALEASWVLWLFALANLTRVNVAASAWLVYALSWLPAVAAAHGVQWCPGREQPPFWRRHLGGIQTTLATLFGLMLVFDVASGAARLAAFSGVVLVAFAVWRWGLVRAARVGMIVLAGVAWLVALRFAQSGLAQGAAAGLIAGLGLATLVAAIPFLVDRDLTSTPRKRFRWICSGAGLLLAFTFLLSQKTGLAPYATASCGLVAVLLFLAGLFGRSRPHRLTGLVGLAVCVARVFLVDLDSTLYRIAAFVAVGLVLLWVGFSYHRFRHLVVEDDKKP